MSLKWVIGAGLFEKAISKIKVRDISSVLHTPYVNPRLIKAEDISPVNTKVKELNEAIKKDKEDTKKKLDELTKKYVENLNTNVLTVK